MTKKIQVFVSSTYLDLKAERQSAVDAILKAGHIPAGMELFAAGDESQLETIKKWIDSSDVFMLILGSRYGSIEPKSKKAYVEVEYDNAVKTGKPFFAAVISDKAIDKKVKEHGKEVLEQDNTQKLKKFREKVLSKTSTFFDEPKDIKLAVFESVASLDKKHSIEGWVRSGEVRDTTPLLNEINRLSKDASRLQKENNNLRNELNRLSESSKEEVDFEEIARVLRNKKLTHEAKNKKTNFDVLNWLDTFKGRLLIGVCNSHAMKESISDQFVFFNLAPELHIYGLVENTAVPGVAYRRYGITEKGLRFIAYCEKKKLFGNQVAEQDAKADHGPQAAPA